MIRPPNLSLPYRSFIFTNGLLDGSSSTVMVGKLVIDSQNPVSLKNASASSCSFLPKKMTCIYLSIAAFCDEV